MPTKTLLVAVNIPPPPLTGCEDFPSWCLTYGTKLAFYVFVELSTQSWFWGSSRERQMGESSSVWCYDTVFTHHVTVPPLADFFFLGDTKGDILKRFTHVTFWQTLNFSIHTELRLLCPTWFQVLFLFGHCCKDAAGARRRYGGRCFSSELLWKLSTSL